MRWDDVLQVVGAAAAADLVLGSLYGGAIRQAGSEAYVTPSLDYTLIGDSEEELWAPHIVQFDQWCPTQAQLILSERALRRLFHRDIPVTYGGVGMWANIEEGMPLSAPDRDGVHARALRFKFSPLRERYDSLTTS